MRKTIRWMAGGMALLALAGCGSGGDGGTGPQTSDFQASVQGSVAGSYEGVGLFRLNEPGPAPNRLRLPTGTMLPGSFVLFSADPDGATRSGQGFVLMRSGDSLPAVGTYPLGLLSLIGGSGFVALYGRASDGQMEQYLGTSGEVRITASTAERVAGSFTFHGVRICSGTADRLDCVRPFDVRRDPLPTGGDIDVSGTFAARRAPLSATPPFGM